MLSKIDSKNLKNSKKKKKKKFLESIEFNDISLETVDYYFNIIKSINESIKLDDIEKEIKEQIVNYNKELHLEHNDYKYWIELNRNNLKDKNFRGNIFAVFNLANKEKTKYDIRPIQLISLLFLTKENSELGGIFLQINTGEGKSLIIQFLAAYLALQGNKVDIISSNTVLADRDAGNKDIIEFYTKLGLTSGKASKDEYDRDIVYGNTQNFQAAILSEEFKESKIRHKRPFNCVIIDEVDSISLDNIISMTQLTDNFPGRSCYQYFYYQIIICFCQIISENPEITEQKNSKEIIHKKIKEMLKEKILEQDGKHLKNKTPIIYPKSMKENIEESIDNWIYSVIRAFTMIENRDFIVKDNIIPVDYTQTGATQKDMSWEMGLHQILQILHNTKSTFENENTNFLSNISFFKRYKGNLYGVTGTFGGSNFQYILKEVYKVSLYKIPPFKTSLLEDWGSHVLTDEQSYMNKILENIKLVMDKKRSILLICKSIDKGKEFYELLNNIYKGKVLMYFTEDDESTVNNILNESKIIVATNLAGRGTDIKISDELERNGGLHVLLSFLPINQRVEDQNYGRAGRKGQRGSCISIILYNNEYGIFEKNELNIDIIKQKREKIEFENIKKLIDNEMKFILEKELLFQDFCSLLNNECKKFNVYEKLNLLELWAKILKNKNIEEIKKNYQILKNDKKKNKIKNNLIKLKDIINYADSAENFFIKIFDYEYEYSWAARLKYSCLLAKEKSDLFHGNFYNQKNSVEEFNKTKTIIDIFIGNLDCLSSLNKIVFSFMKKNEEKSKDKNFKTEIEKQNDILKIFFETLKKLIDENIDTVQKFIQENKPKDKIELDKLLTIEDIMKISQNINIENKKDIEVYMDEFGFKNFEVLIIKKNKKYIGNIIIITLGVLQTCVGTVLLFYSSNTIIFKVARYLIREGIKDIIKGIRSTVQGEEINLKSYALEKGISLVGFALDLALGGACDIGQDVKDRIFSVVKDECINLAKTYANNYIANKIVKKLINLLQDKLKSFIITPLMDNMLFDGENIEKCIQCDIINGNDENKELILDNCSKIFDELDNLIDFIGPIIELCKILISKNNEEKLIKLFEFLSNNIDIYNTLNIIKDKIYNILKNSKLQNESKIELSSLIKTVEPSFSDEDVDEICKELIECGVINKNGELNKKISPIKGFEQSFKLNIDKKYLKYEYNKKNNISDKIREKLNLKLIFGKMNKVNFNTKKNEIKDEMYNRLETFIQSIIEKILELIEDKVGEKLQKLYEKYKKKKKSQNGELDTANDIDEKKVKNRENEGKEENTVQISKAANSNKNGEDEKINVTELNTKEIKKNKFETEMKKNSTTIICEKNKKEFFKETSEFFVKFGTQAGFNNVIIPKIIDLLSDFVKKKIKENLLPMILDRLDEHFEQFGEHIIILQKNYKIKGYFDTIIKLIRQFFHIITVIQKFIIPILKNLVNKIQKGEDCIKIICNLNQELISKLDKKFIIPFKNFINEVFGEKGNVEKYKFFEKIIEDGYKKVKGICIDKYEGEIKTFASKKYEEYKNYYLNKRNQICDIPNELVNKYEELKQKIKSQYNKSKENIINSTNSQIEFLKTFNYNIEFKKISKALK